MTLYLQPVNFRDAATYVDRYHRHLKPPIGNIFCLAAHDGNRLVGVLIAGRPIAHQNDDGLTLEVTRCCTDGTPNVNSFLYAAAWRATRALGYYRLITYTLVEESGVSLKALKELGWHPVAMRPKPTRWTVRPGRENNPIYDMGKQQWEVTATTYESAQRF